ncbi:ion channel [Croceicoccus sp. YJ47]|uniref:ion channel n=1 Tax=Croceicoccus sp. YJ47 TaxID=2798724 RepID=UPI001923D2A1|nr:ion channel [Croceicoccus sp. YJ47]QQN73463.1 transporter substrate-binding domain-containing protein [Croceicoccus sp. YJ47]
MAAPPAPAQDAHAQDDTVAAATASQRTPETPSTPASDPGPEEAASEEPLPPRPASPAYMPTTRGSGPVQVAVAEVAPYAIRNADGRWTGPALDLFRAAAEESGLDYTLVPTSPDAIGRSDAAVAFPVYATASLANDARRSLPFHVDSVGLIGRSPGGGFLAGLAGLLNTSFLRVVAIVSAVLLVVGAIFYFVERKTNEGLHADDGRMHGIGHGFWWAGVTATTIGYGDLVPKTTWGRVVAMIWMLFSMALTAILTAYIISLTGARGGRTALTEAVSGLAVGYVADGTIAGEDLRGADALREFPTMDAALAAYDEEEIDAVAAPYQQAREMADDREVQRTSGSVVMPVFRVTEQGDFRAALDRIILSPDWQSRIEREFSDR